MDKSFQWCGATIEELEEYCDKNNIDRDNDRYYLEMQARLGSKEDKKAAYDENGNWVRCIHWFDCEFCPAFNSRHCL